MTAMVQQVINDLTTQISTISDLVGPDSKPKVFQVLNREELVLKAKALVRPFAGVWYQGITQSGEQQKGLDARVRATIILAVETRVIGNLDEKPHAMEILDKMRGVLLNQKSPTGHFWKFEKEVPFGEFEGSVIYFQMWSTAWPNPQPFPGRAPR